MNVRNSLEVWLSVSFGALFSTQAQMKDQPLLIGREAPPFCRYRQEEYCCLVECKLESALVSGREKGVHQNSPYEQDVYLI